MRLLVLGGTHFVGRAVVEEALAAGHRVTTLTTGRSGPPAPGVDGRRADRHDPGSVATALGEDRWDAVLDTWSGHPDAVATTARLLSGRVGHYGYVSSRSVHRWPIPLDADESAPLVDYDPDGDSDYAQLKRGGELATAAFDGPILLARAGLILGPYEDVGRLPFWLDRMARGGRVPVPGPPDRGLQFIDARDLARWMLDCAERRTAGAFNAVSRPGHTTMGELIEACRAATGCDADLIWVSPEQVAAAGVEPWTELPIWLPPDGQLAALHRADVGRALAAGLRCRPASETVADTWSWWRTADRPGPHPRAARPMDAAAEQRLLAAADV